MTSIEDARKVTAMQRIADDEHSDVSNDEEHADVSDHERLRMVNTVLVMFRHTHTLLHTETCDVAYQCSRE